MSRILVGNVTSEGDRLIRSYLEKFLPDASIEPLRASGIYSRIKMNAKKPDVALIIIDEALYDTCEQRIGEYLKLPKVHKYMDDNGLRMFLEAKFGVLDVGTDSTAVEQPMEEESTVVEDEPEAEVVSSVVTGDNVDFSDMGVVDESSDVVEKLRRELNQANLLVKSLTQQIEDANRDSDVKDFVDRIRELEAKITEKEEKINELENQHYVSLGKVTKAEEVLKKLNDTEVALNHQKELTLQAEALRDELNKKITELEDQVDDLAKYPKELESAKAELEKSNLEYKKVYAEYESKCDEYTTLEQRFSSVSGGNEEYQKKIEELTNQILNLEQQVSESAKARSSAERELKVSKTDVDTRVEQINTLSTQLNDLKEKNRKLQDDFNGASRKCRDTQTELQNSLDEITKLSSELKETEKDNVILKNKVSSLERVESENASLQTAIEALREQLKLAEEKAQETKINLNELTIKYSDAEDKIAELNSTIKLRDGHIATLDTQIQNLTETTERSLGVEKNLRLLRNELDTTRDNLVAKTEEFAKMSKARDEAEHNVLKVRLELEGKIADEKREVEKLTTELALIKRGEDESGKTADLRLRILDLQEEIQSLKKSQDENHAEDVLRLQSELSEYKEKAINLETDLADREAYLNELYESVFLHMNDCAMPKLKVDVSLPLTVENLNKCYVIAGGSAESNLFVYKVLKNTCATNKKKKIIVIDLSTDTYIDSEFKLKSIKTPLPWLQGKSPITEFVADTCFGNTKVVSTGLAYFNPLYMLNLNWVDRLNELARLQKSVDAIIINVGILDSVVTKVVFQSFATIMKSHVVVRATPINIRTTLLSLAGLVGVAKTEVDCVQYDTVSKVMYQKLASSYTAKILHDNEGVELGAITA